MKQFHILSVFLIASIIAGNTAAVSLAAEIIYIEGNVQAQSAVEKAWGKAELGMPLNIGDSVRTARRSKADILVDKENKHTVRVEEQTLVVLNSTSPGQINKIDLSNGKVFADVEMMKEGMTFEISTPSSTAGVRGSGMGVESNRDRDEFAAFKDNVYLKSYDQQNNLIAETTIPEGFKAGADRFEGPGEITRLSDADRERWNEVRQDLTQRAQGGSAGDEEKAEELQMQELAQFDEISRVIETNLEKINEVKDQIRENITEERIQGCITIVEELIEDYLPQ